MSEDRGYFTWEEDLCSERRELRGFKNELVAVVDQSEASTLYHIENAAGLRIRTGMQLEHAKRAAEGLL